MMMHRKLGSIVFKDGDIPVTSNEYTHYDLVGNRRTEVDLSKHKVSGF